MATPSIQDQLVQLAQLNKSIQEAEHPNLVALEQAVMDPSVDTLLAALDKAVNSLAKSDQLKSATKILADTIRTVRTQARREKQLSEEAIAAHG